MSDFARDPLEPYEGPLVAPIATALQYTVCPVILELYCVWVCVSELPLLCLP